MLDVGCMILPFEDVFRFGKSFLHLSLSGLHLFKDIGLSYLRMKKGSLFFESIFDLKNCWKWLKLHDQSVEGFLAGFRSEGGNSSEPIPFIEGMIRQDLLVLNQKGRRWIPCTIERALGDILRKEDGKNAIHLLCFGWIDVKDPRMGIRASKDGTIDHTR
jgi:hypothetical protein